MPALITRAQWGARAAIPGGNRFSRAVEGCTVHWEGPRMGTFAHSLCAAKVRQVQTFHMNTRGWKDIAYNYLACPHGFVYEGRQGGNGANGDASNGWRMSICALVGSGDPQPMLLLDAIRDAVAFARAKGAGGSIDAHSDHQQTDCPGNLIRANIKAGRFQPGAKPKPTAPAPPQEDPMPTLDDIRAVIRDEVRKALADEDTARSLWTGHRVVLDTRTTDPDAPRVAPSALLETIAAAVTKDAS